MGPLKFVAVNRGLASECRFSGNAREPELSLAVRNSYHFCAVVLKTEIDNHALKEK